MNTVGQWLHQSSCAQEFEIRVLPQSSFITASKYVSKFVCPEVRGDVLHFTLLYKRRWSFLNEFTTYRLPPSRLDQVELYEQFHDQKHPRPSWWVVFLFEPHPRFTASGIMSKTANIALWGPDVDEITVRPCKLCGFAYYWPFNRRWSEPSNLENIFRGYRLSIHVGSLLRSHNWTLTSFYIT